MTNSIISIDKSLTPETALSKGYVWVSDKLFDIESSEQVLKELVIYSKAGYSLGQPAIMKATPNNMYGLYKPTNLA